MEGGSFVIKTDVNILYLSVEIDIAPSSNIFLVNGKTLKLNILTLGSPSNINKDVSNSLIKVTAQGILYLNKVTLEYVTLKGTGKKGACINLDGISNPEYIKFGEDINKFIDAYVAEEANTSKYYIISNPTVDTDTEVVRRRLESLGRLNNGNKGVVNISGVDTDIYENVPRYFYIDSTGPQVTRTSSSKWLLSETLKETKELSIGFRSLKITGNEEIKEGFRLSGESCSFCKDSVSDITITMNGAYFSCYTDISFKDLIIVISNKPKNENNAYVPVIYVTYSVFSLTNITWR